MKSRRMRWAGHVAPIGAGRNLYRVLVGKPEGKRPLERPRHRWEYVIRMDLREIGWGLWSGFTWLRIGSGGWSRGCGDEPPSSGDTDLIS
jgi:hypothetical protein